MLPSFLLSECLEKIFLNLLDKNSSGDAYTYTSTKDLYSCTLVSRHWCRTSTPFLYAYPFHHFRHFAYPNIYFHNETYLSYFKLIRTLISCIPKSEIEQIILSNSSSKLSNLFDFNEETINLTTFNYVKFIRGLIFDKILSNTYKLFRYQKIWFPPYISNNNITENQFSKISIPIINHFLKFLCKNCNNLSTLDFPFTIQNNEFFNSIIELLTFNDFNGKNKLRDLKELYYINNYVGRNEEVRSPPNDLYMALSNYSCRLNLLYNEQINSIEKANSLSRFISLQKMLQHIILSENKRDSVVYAINRLFGDDNIDNNYNIVFNSLSTQSETLKILEFKYIPFNKINEKALNSLCLLKNIRILKLYKCREIYDNLNSWAKNLTRLEVFEFVAYYIPTISEGFLVQLIQSSSKTLTKLVLHYKREHNQVFQQIPFYSHLLIHLELPKIFPDELILIFKSCTKLIYFSTILSDHGSWENIFRNLGKFIPKNLRKIQFKEMDYLVFSSNELKCFFQECINSNSKLKYLEIIGKCDDVNQEYFKVAREFGMELIKE
ncbi:hypothetical protein C1646_756716 [Rhizophagus diaphanus]|nr:hypothetical protein C1646_756716 [Rhizophagus diaphanus] [Rhizophagus sp. MUCL 43196]